MRQPETASSHTTTAIIVRSASGYERFVAIAAFEPLVASSTAWKTTAVPVAATARLAMPPSSHRLRRMPPARVWSSSRSATYTGG